MNKTPRQVPITFQQRWLLSLIERQPGWNCLVAQAFNLQGVLDEKALRHSLAEVIRRHGALRTRVVTIEGATSQHIDVHHEYPLPIRRVDSRSGTGCSTPEDLSTEDLRSLRVGPAIGSMVSFNLLKWSDRRHWLVASFHRLIADCSSIEQVLRELWLLYAEFSQGRPSPLQPDPPQYSDYAIWQETTHSQWMKKNSTYWKSRLAEAVPIHWPVVRIEPRIARGEIGRMSCQLSDALSTELREMARRARTLAATAMLAVYVAVLWRWCHQKNFIVPIKIAGRQSEHKPIVGYFTHILYLRLQLTGSETFTELLDRVSREFFTALAHQDFGMMATERPDLLGGCFSSGLLEVPNSRTFLSQLLRVLLTLQLSKYPLRILVRVSQRYLRVWLTWN